MRRELFAPMEQVGLPSSPVDLHEAIALVGAALDRTAQVGWRIPSLRHQPVLDRIERWLMRPQRGGTGRHPVTGACGSGGAALLVDGRGLAAPARASAVRGGAATAFSARLAQGAAQRGPSSSGAAATAATSAPASRARPQGERGHRDRARGPRRPAAGAGRTASARPGAPDVPRAQGDAAPQAPGPPSTSPSRPPFAGGLSWPRRARFPAGFRRICNGTVSVSCAIMRSHG